MTEHGVTPRELKIMLNEQDRRWKIELQALADKSEAAQNAAKEMAEKHNDLLRQMERKDATYAGKAEVGLAKDAADKAIALVQERADERFSRLEKTLSRATGAIGVLGVIGVANLVKLFAG